MGYHLTTADDVETGYFEPPARAAKYTLCHRKPTRGPIFIWVLSRQYPEIDKDRLGREAAALADDESASEPARITALRICGMLKRHEALETARITAQAGTTVLLRMAAIATLGELGEQQDLEYLQAATPTEVPRLKPVMEAAMKAIRVRLGGTQG